MITLDRGVQLALAKEAGRAPSAHNSQPARWRFGGDGSLVLFEDRTRRLTISDPSGRDARIGLGAAFEGMRLALSRHGLGLTDPVPVVEPADPPAALVPVATVRLHTVDGPDPLADVVSRRHTYRGVFRPAGAEVQSRLTELLAASPDVERVSRSMKEVARRHDACSMEFLAQPAWLAELRGWMRFSPSDPRWTRDGLIATCMGLSAVERSVAPWLMLPPVFRALTHLGATRLLMSDARAVRSSAAIVVLHHHPDEGDLAAGRRFYRFLLELCAAGFSACPMSALVDSERGRDWLRQQRIIPEGREPVSVFRVGPAPAPAASAAPAVPQYRSPRLPAEELLV